MRQRRAFSYARFSTAEQRDGFSLARQIDKAKAYCARNNLILDDQSFCDLGVSGFRGSNALAGDLAQFIDLVKSGRIPKGSVLIVENTDRLSRLPPDEANQIITGIVRAGVDIVTTSPEQIYTAANIDKLATWLPLQVSNCLAHEESLKKSDRIKDAWARQRSALAQGKKLLARAPFWLKANGADGWALVPQNVELVRQMFRWAADGVGLTSMLGHLHRVRPDGIKGRGWRVCSVWRILRSRSVLGEFQPHVGSAAKKGGIKATRRPVGQPLTDYFPAIVSEAEFYRAQQALDSRHQSGGRNTGVPNLFSGILYDARDKKRLALHACRGVRVLVSSGAIRKQAGSEFRSVPYEIVETAILSRLQELRSSDVDGRAAPPEDDIELWSNKLTTVNHKIEQAQQRATKADDPTVFLDLLDRYARDRKQIVAALERAKIAGASPAGDALGECTSLVELLHGCEKEEREELRRRIKAALARLVKDVWALIVRRGRDRLIAVQLNFRGDQARRSYLIEYTPQGVSGYRGTIKTPARCECRSLTDAELLTAARGLDLRDSKHVAALEKLLLAEAR